MRVDDLAPRAPPIMVEVARPNGWSSAAGRQRRRPATPRMIRPGRAVCRQRRHCGAVHAPPRDGRPVSWSDWLGDEEQGDRFRAGNRHAYRTQSRCQMRPWGRHNEGRDCVGGVANPCCRETCCGSCRPQATPKRPRLSRGESWRAIRAKSPESTRTTTTHPNRLAETRLQDREVPSTRGGKRHAESSEA